MKNQTHSIQDCGCSDGCCTPQKKNNPWQKWIFIAIIVAAAAIVTIKLVNKEEAIPEKCCDKTENPACCPKDKSETDSTGCAKKGCKKGESCSKSKTENNE